MIAMRNLSLCIAAAAVAVATAMPASAQQQVGVNAAVNPDATGTPPGAGARRLVMGQPVVFNEHIATQAAGQTQIMFLDESAMTVGPDSDVTIDQFVYDPNAGTGKLAMSATRGVLRYVGGKISKQDNAVTLRTPSATLAVRGGVFIADQSRGQFDVHFLYGAGLSVTGTNGVMQSVQRPGFSITVAAPGLPPSPPFPTPPAVLARLVGALDGRPGSSGGAARPPTAATVASSGVSVVISGDITASVQAAAQAQPAATQPAPINVANLQTNLQVNTVQSQGTPAVALLDMNPSQSGAVAQSYSLAGFAVGQPQSKEGSFGIASATLEQNGVLKAAASNFAVSFPLASGTNNLGPAGTSGVVGGVSIGSFSGTSYLAPDNSFFYAIATSPSFPGKFGAVIGGVPTVNLPTSGTGTFSGSATGAVFNNGSTYLATGGFSNVYNFGTNSGSVTISNLDGKTYSALVTSFGKGISLQTTQQLAALGITVPANVANLLYSGSLSGSGVAGAIAGGFFGNAASSTGGYFKVKSPKNAFGVSSYIVKGLYGGNR